MGRLFLASPVDVTIDPVFTTHKIRSTCALQLVFPRTESTGTMV